MRNMKLITFVLSVTLIHAVARESIREGEQSGIPDRADVEKEIKEEGENEGSMEKKKEVRENQEHTDPVFYDSTTSPKEMEENKDI